MRVLLVLAAAACHGVDSGVDPGDDTDGDSDATAAAPFIAPFPDRLELVPGALGAVAWYAVDIGGPVDALEVTSCPPGVTCTVTDEPPGDAQLLLGNLAADVAVDAPTGPATIEVTAHGPGGDATWVLQLFVVAPEGAGIALGLGANDVPLHPGDAREVPVRAVSYGGFAGDVALWGGDVTRELRATLDDASGPVAPGVPFETTVRIEHGWSVLGGAEAFHLHAASLRAQAEAEVRYRLDATPDADDVWPTLGRGPIVLRAGESVDVQFDTYGGGTVGEPTFEVDAPAGWTASVVPGPAVNRALRVTATGSAPEGGADLVVRSTLGTAHREHVVRVARPPVTGDWAFVGDGSLAVDDTTTAVWDGSQTLRAVSAPMGGGIADSHGIAWGVARNGGGGVDVLRGGAVAGTLALPTGTAGDVRLVMPPDDRPWVLATTAGGAVHAWRFREFGLYDLLWDALPPLTSDDGGAIRPLDVAVRDGRLLVAGGSSTAFQTSRGPSSITSWVWDGDAWRGTFLSPGRTFDPAGPSQLAAAFDADGLPLVAWIDADDGAVHVDRPDGASPGPVGSPIAPSSGRIAVAVDLAVDGDDHAVLLVHEAPDLAWAQHPGVGAPSRLRVLRVDGDWVAFDDVTLPDAIATPTSILLGVGPSEGPRAVFASPWGVYAADPR